MPLCGVTVIYLTILLGTFYPAVCSPAGSATDSLALPWTVRTSEKAGDASPGSLERSFGISLKGDCQLATLLPWNTLGFHLVTRNSAHTAHAPNPTPLPKWEPPVLTYKITYLPSLTSHSSESFQTRDKRIWLKTKG